MRKNLINYSNTIKNEKMKEYIQYQYCALSVDAGKNNGASYLLINLCNSIKKTYPIIIHLEDNFRGDYENYKKVMRDLCIKLISQNIIICGIVSDNLPVQEKAYNHAFSSSFQFESTDPMISSIIWIPCGCHLLALTINDLEKSNFSFKHDIEILIEHYRALTSKKVRQLLRKNSPKLCSTRWTCYYDVSKFIIKNQIEIFEIFRSFPEFMPLFESKTNNMEAINDIFILLMPLKYASLKMESNSISSGYVFPIILKTMEMVSEYGFKYLFDSKISEELNKHIMNRFILSPKSTVYRNLFSFTPEGRNFIRSSGEVLFDGKQIFDDLIPQSSFEISEKDVSLINHDRILKNLRNPREISKNNEMENSIVQQCPRNRKPVEIHSLISLDDDIYYSDISDSDSDYCEIEIIDQNDDEEILSKDLPSIYDSTLELLKHIINQRHYCPEVESNILEAYSVWISGNPSSIPSTHMMKNSHEIYDLMYSHKKWREFALIVKGLLSIPASEAQCERGFWKLRNISNSKCPRISKELIESRIFLMSHK